MTGRAGRGSAARPLGLPLDACRSLTVTARLQRPAALDDDWPLPLDGLLASAAGRRAGARPAETIDLPLVRHRGGSTRWWWCASCAEESDDGMTLTWRAVGDRRAVEDLVVAVTQVGGDRRDGCGQVETWDVVDDGPADRAWALWRADGTIARPVPATSATTIGLPADVATVEAAYRPPYWRPPVAATPGEFAREWRACIAPDVRRPT